MKILGLAICAIVVLTISGCGRVSTEKGLADCQLDALKITADEKRRADIVRACMSAKGYKTKSEDGCFGYVHLTMCWQRTWRVILP